MAKLMAVIRREYLERVRSKWFVFTTLLAPLFFAGITFVPLLLGARSKPSADATNVLILDATGTDLGARVKSLLAAGLTDDTARAEVRVLDAAALPDAEREAAAAVVAKERMGYLVLSADALARDTIAYQGRNASSIRDVSVLERAVRQAVLSRRLQEEGLDPRRIAALTAVRTQLKAEVLDERGKGGSGIGGVIFGYSVALVLYMMIVLYGQNILRGVLEEKTTRVAEVIVASVKPDVLLAGKVLGVGAVGLTQVVAWIVMGLQLWRLRAPIAEKLGTPLPPLELPPIGVSGAALLLAYFLLGYTLYASLFAAVGAMVSNQEDAQQAATPVTLLVVLAVVFMQPVLLQPNGTLAQVVTLIPFTAPILMPLRLTSVQVPAWEIATSLALVALTCAGCIWLSARIYRVGLLMYGKRPSMGELVRWVRQS